MKSGKAAGMMGLILAIVIAGATAGISADVVIDLRSDQTANTAAYNASTDGLIGITEFSSWFDTIALVMAAVIVLGYLLFLR